MDKKIATYNYDNVDLKLSNHKNNITIIIITNMSWVLQIGYNLLSNISLAKKGIEVFLRKTSQFSKIIADNKVFRLTNIIEN